MAKRNWASIFADAVARDLCAADICRELGVTASLVSQMVKYHGVQLWDARDYGRDWPVILRDALARGLSLRDVCKEQGVTSASAFEQMRRHQVSLPRAMSRSWGRTKRDWPAILAQAVHDGVPNNQLAAQLGLDPTSVSSAARKHGVILPLAKGGRRRALASTHAAPGAGSPQVRVNEILRRSLDGPERDSGGNDLRPSCGSGTPSASCRSAV